MRVELPPGVTVEGIVWGRLVPLWLERDGVYSQAGRVAPDAPVCVSLPDCRLCVPAKSVRAILRASGIKLEGL